MWRRIKAVFRVEVGGINIGNILMLGIGMIFIAVGFIVYPIVLDGIVEVLNSDSIDIYTGLEPVAKVVPLIVLIGFVSAGVVTGFFGVKNIMG